ncbi:MAG: penicillin acylase family protein [Pseudomonadota bacterium]
MRRILAYGAGGLAALLVLAFLAGYVWLKGTLPDYTKTLTSDALSAPVKIERDEYGVPHITAQTFNDAAFAMGYAQAQDRLWQMETFRRAVMGRTAEVFGEAFFHTDVAYKGLYRFPEAYEKTNARLDPETRRTFDAFAAGVNLAIQSGEGMSSPEWALLGIKPAPWTAGDVNSFMAVVSETATDGPRELAIAKHESVLEKEIFDFLYEELPPEFPTLYEDFEEKPAANARRGVGDADPNRSGTNFFVFGPERTTTGKPILAVDPHLPLYAPGVVYPVVVTLPDDVIAGGAWVGTPAVTFGHNSKIAWGMTHMYADTMDYIVEKIDPDNPDNYMTENGSEPFLVRDIEVKVKGAGVRTIKVRETRNGVVVSDRHLYEAGFDAFSGGLADAYAVVEETFGPGHVVVRRQVNSEVGQLTIQSLLNVSRAHNWEEFQNALREYEWTNNVVYADVEGNIGVQMSARLPNRRPVNGWDGERMARGWLGEGVWDGYVPFDELPYVFNPPKGWIADSNGRAVLTEFPYRLTNNYSPPWRVMRAYELISAKQKHSMESVMDIQLDVYSAQAAWLTERLLQFDAGSDAAREAFDMLASWDFVMDRNRPEPLLYSAIELALQESLVNVRHDSIARRYPVILPLARMLETDHPWCDDVRTENVETCEDAVNAAVDKSVARISAAYGADMSKWRWGDVHISEFPAFFSWANVPVLDDLTMPRYATDGATSVLNVASTRRPDAPFDDLLSGLEFIAENGATYRMVADMSDVENSKFMLAPGVSGNAMSPHWDDLVEPWAEGVYFHLAGRTPRKKQVTMLEPAN